MSLLHQFFMLKISLCVDIARTHLLHEDHIARVAVASPEVVDALIAHRGEKIRLYVSVIERRIVAPYILKDIAHDILTCIAVGDESSGKGSHQSVVVPIETIKFYPNTHKTVAKLLIFANNNKKMQHFFYFFLQMRILFMQEVR